MTDHEKNAAGGEPGTGGAVAHANQLRGAEFKRLIGLARTWIWIGGIAVVLGGVLAASILPVIGLAVAIGVVLVGLIVVFVIADHRAEEAFYDSYCESHGLTRLKDAQIGALTPLLRKGDKRRTDEMFSGELAPGIEGSLVLWTYTEVSHDSDGDRTETDYPFTLVHVYMPEIVPHLPKLLVEKAGFKLFDKLEDKLGGHQRVTLESEAFHKRYEVFVDKGQDQVWVRRLFSPSWIVWLTEQTPPKFGFELENGNLIAYIPKHKDNVEDLEAMTRVSTDVARRLLEEVAQTSPRAERETTQ
jgi:hypothetical protein